MRGLQARDTKNGRDDDERSVPYLRSDRPARSRHEGGANRPAAASIGKVREVRDPEATEAGLLQSVRSRVPKGISTAHE